MRPFAYETSSGFSALTHPNSEMTTVWWVRSRLHENGYSRSLSTAGARQALTDVDVYCAHPRGREVPS